MYIELVVYDLRHYGVSTMRKCNFSMDEHGASKKLKLVHVYFRETHKGKTPTVLISDYFQ